MALNRETLISKLLSLSKFQHNHRLLNLSDRKLEALYLDHILFHLTLTADINQLN
ncbi:hypothetical protein LLY41_13680 [Cytobacillus firmus]|uniref:hypothetical protein n=1 Tax=Cytobacillus firmus TaxID=1399 RepID=UPI00218A9192|nr:hypothetical protein [Cytobacillus firmus]URM31477.1 hypothetical protein LLY41_13680 [Cytobacillus firmus]